MGSYFGSGNYSGYGNNASFGYPGNWNSPAYGSAPNAYSSSGSLSPAADQFTIQKTPAREEKGEKAETKQDGITGFFKGIVNGAVNAVKSLFTPQGLLMAAATLGLIWMTGGAILPLLAVIGMGIGGFQIAKGAASGNTEAMGEGVFTFATSAIGLKANPSSITVGEGAAAKTFTLAGSKEGQSAGMLEQLKSPFGLAKYQAADGSESLTMYQLAMQKSQSRFSAMKGKLGDSTQQQTSAAEKAQQLKRSDDRQTAIEVQKLEDAETLKAQSGKTYSNIEQGDQTVQLRRSETGQVEIIHHGESKQPVFIENQPVPPNSRVQLQPGQITQIGDRLYKVTPDRQLFKVSDDANLVHELFPNGLNHIHFQQGNLGDCVKLSQMKAMLEDPSGKGTAALLSRIRRQPDGGYSVDFAQGRTISLKGKKFVTDAYGRKFIVQKNPAQVKTVTGDLGIQVLERAHYKQVKQDYLANGSNSQPVPPSLIQHGQPVKSLSTEVTKSDKSWGDDFTIRLAGKDWEPVNIDGLKRYTSNTKSAWNERRTFAERIQTSPGIRQQLNQIFTRIEQAPEQMRVSAISRATGSDRVQFTLPGGRTIFGHHAYYLKGITRDAYGNRVFQLVNPHDTRFILPLSETEFLNHFSMLNGVRHNSFGAL